MTTCRTCDLVVRRDRGEAPAWDVIFREEAWNVVHAYDTSLEGWTVLVLRRHATVIADLTHFEAASLGQLLSSARRCTGLTNQRAAHESTRRGATPRTDSKPPAIR